VRRGMPDGDGSSADDYPTLVQHAVARYVGGQMLFSLVMGATTGLALYIVGVVGVFPTAPLRRRVRDLLWADGARAVCGPDPGSAAGDHRRVAHRPDLRAVGDADVVCLQQLEGHIVAPQIFGTPCASILCCDLCAAVGLQVHGVIGALIALPILAVLRETAVYLSRHLSLESWNGPGAECCERRDGGPGSASATAGCRRWWT